MVSWGGSYARACVDGYHKAFTAETGIEIKLEDYNGGLAEVRAQVDAGNVRWDVVDVELADGVRGCDEGLFKVFDPATLPPGADGRRARRTTTTRTQSRSAARTRSTTPPSYAYNAREDSRRQADDDAGFLRPRTLSRSPGHAPLTRRKPRVRADGGMAFPAEQVYALLDTEAGPRTGPSRSSTRSRTRSCGGEAGAQPPQMLADGEVLMSTALQRAASSTPQVLEEQPFVIVWDGQVLDTGYLAILEGAPNADAAQRFVEFAARPASMAGNRPVHLLQPGRGARPNR